jgi:hypothetical protein
MSELVSKAGQPAVTGTVVVAPVVVHRPQRYAATWVIESRHSFATT